MTSEQIYEVRMVQLRKKAEETIGDKILVSASGDTKIMYSSKSETLAVRINNDAVIRVLLGMMQDIRIFESEGKKVLRLIMKNGCEYDIRLE